MGDSVRLTEINENNHRQQRLEVSCIAVHELIDDAIRQLEMSKREAARGTQDSMRNALDGLGLAEQTLQRRADEPAIEWL